MENNRFNYYQDLKRLAREIRSEYGVTGYRVGRADMRRICKGCGVDDIDLWPTQKGTKPFKKLRGAYFCDGCGCTIMIARSLPDEPAIFTMAHELKHHLCDQNHPVLFCNDWNVGEEIEIGAEVFAAELIFPDEEFLSCMASIGVSAGKCLPEDLVRLKQETETTLSYAALSKRAEFYDFAAKKSLSTYKGWVRLQESMYGVPPYKQAYRTSKRLGSAS